MKFQALAIFFRSWSKMKNRTGNQFKRLSRTPKHRKNMTKNMIAQMIAKQRINTTLAKSKYLQFYLDNIISLAHDSIQRNALHPRIPKLISQPAKHMTALFQLASRFSPNESVSSVLRNGTRGQGGSKEDADHADMAVLEFKGTRHSISTALAFKNIQKIRNDLESVNRDLYDTRVVELIDPVDSSIKQFSFYDEKKGLDVSEYQRLKRHGKHSLILERKYQNLLVSLDSEIKQYEQRNDLQTRNVDRYTRLASDWVQQLHEKTQLYIDSVGKWRGPTVLRPLTLNGFKVKGRKVLLDEVVPREFGVVDAAKRNGAEDSAAVEQTATVVDPAEKRSGGLLDKVGSFFKKQVKGLEAK